jgi:hypothetical protein
MPAHLSNTPTTSNCKKEGARNARLKRVATVQKPQKEERPVEQSAEGAPAPKTHVALIGVLPSYPPEPVGISSVC